MVNSSFNWLPSLNLYCPCIILLVSLTCLLYLFKMSEEAVKNIQMLIVER